MPYPSLYTMPGLLGGGLSILGLVRHKKVRVTIVVFLVSKMIEIILESLWIMDRLVRAGLHHLNIGRAKKAHRSLLCFQKLMMS